MFQNYISVALRNLIKHKLYSAINIVGLAVGLAACVLITLFVRDEMSFDTFWKDADKLYRMNTTFNVPGREPFVTVMAMGPAKGAIERYFAGEVEAVTRFNNEWPVIEYDNKVFSEEVYFTDPETVDMFSLDVVAGDIKQSLNDNSTLVVNESFAKKHFGDKDPIGEVMTLTYYATTRDYRIGAVYKDLPHNSVMDFRALIMIDEADFENFPWEYGHWFSVNNNIFFKLKDGVSIDALNARWKDFTDTMMDVRDQIEPGTNPSDFVTFSSQPLLDIQLYPAGDGEMKPTGDIKTVMIFSAIAGLILLIACINFMNLATAKSTQRAREVAIRKVMGARRGQLITQFLGESILLALIGLVLGIVLVEMALPVYSDFLGRELTFEYSDGTTLAILLGLIAFVGTLGGFYPAIALSGFQPSRVLKANKSAETSGSIMLRNALVVLQFTISIGLIVSTAVVYGQMVYGQNMDPGYQKDNMLVIRNVGRSGMLEQQEAFKQEVLRMQGVNNASLTSGRPADGNESNSSVEIPGNPEAGSILLGRQGVDHDFFETYQIPFVAGRAYDLSRGTDGTPSSEGAKEGEVLQGTVVVNERTIRRLGFGTPEEAIGKVVRMGVGDDVQADLSIIGVVPDINFQSLRQIIRPEMYVMSDSWKGNLTINFNGDAQALLSQVENVWKRMAPTVPFSYEYVDQALAEEFEAEQALATMLGGFSMLAIAVACLGLYGLASFTAERRTKEIGIRKVLGASVIDIVRLLIWQFSKPVLVANLIAWPLAVWGMMSWLETFPYRIDTWLLIPLCLFAGFIALMIAWGTVGGNAAKVARSNPIKALRYE
ncbi:ABC transporter permease [Kordiimonas lacus]|uniref:Putative ABC transport system permease protein n=1 Tax=Kordiimonas lacus TaxID=637679 RepID=A0A1G6ZVB1_9PROT|nr:ABC transporter permease [Kordiimonas lacus]SDE06273.1 putative ABC transport system permease protein [Kordiimonas lacus]